MNAVDNFCMINKYNDKPNNKHMSSHNNMSNWLTINSIKNTKHISRKYRKYLNQSNVNIIKECAENNIKIMPTFYKLNAKDILSIIKHSFLHNFPKILTNVNVNHF